MQADQTPDYSHDQGSYFRMFPVSGCHYERPQLLQVVEAINNKVVTITDPSSTPAGYTYLGQFIDHEITHMQHLAALPAALPLPLTQLVQRRSCAFDLDSVYGRGLADAVVPYTAAGLFYSEFTRNGVLYDLPRGLGPRAMEPRIAEFHNDENFIVAQWQVLFMNAHNWLMEKYRSRITDLEQRFLQVRQELSLVLQALVIRDFLPRFIDPQIHAAFFGEEATIGGSAMLAGLGRAQAGMPLEFAGAAYRFGHSLVRGSYALNDEYQLPVNLRALFGLTGKGGLRSLETRQPGADLRPYAIDWKYFFPMGYPYHSNALTLKPKVADQLRELVNEAPGNQDLLLRNLLRGQELGLPSAQAICQWLQTARPDYCRWLDFQALSVQQLASHDLGPALARAGLQDKVPLWLYVLMEPAFNDSDNSRLGQLGSLILAETFRMLVRWSLPSLVDDVLAKHQPEVWQEKYPVLAALLFPARAEQQYPLTSRFIHCVTQRS